MIVCRVGLLISFDKMKSRGYHAFLEVKLVGFDLNLIALGLFTISPIPSLVSFTIVSLNAEYSGISTMANSQREQQPTEESKNRK